MRVIGRYKPHSRPYMFGTFFISGSKAVTCLNTGPDKFDSLDDLIDFVLYPPRGTRSRGRDSREEFHWITHGGGGQDFSMLIARLHPVLIKRGLSAKTISSGTRIMTIEIETPKGMVILEDWWHASKTENPEDAEQLYRMVTATRKIDRDYFGVDTARTITTTARKAWQVTIPEEIRYFRQHPDKEDFIRQACIGAIVFPGDSLNLLTPQEGEELAAVTIDRNGAFAAEMRKGGYPTSAGCWTREYMPGYRAIYQVEITCPETVSFPFVHIFWEQDGVTRKALRYGSGTAYLTDEAYLRAKDRGYQLKVVEGIFFKRTEDVFSEFISKCDRLEHDETLPLEVRKRAKFFRNHLNGGFNMTDEVESIVIGKPPLGSEPWFDDQTGMPLPGYKVKGISERPHIQPAWYAFTVQRQMLWMEEMYHNIPEGMRGPGDTDSVTARPQAIRELGVTEGTSYGEVKMEKKWMTLQGFAKNYAGITSDGSVVTKCSGVPKTVIARHVNEFARAMGGEKISVSWESFSLSKALSQEPSSGLLRSRTLGTPESLQHNWDVDLITGRIYPLGRAKLPYAEPEDGGVIPIAEWYELHPDPAWEADWDNLMEAA